MQQLQSATTIFGGGIAGGVLAKRLSRDMQVTLVDPLEYFEIPMAAPRHLVSPDYARQAIIPFAKSLPNVRHVRGKLVELTSEGALVEESEGDTIRIVSDIEILATGSRFATELVRPHRGTADDRMEFYARTAERVAKAKRIVIVGGGPIGVEVAGEISHSYPGKSLTIVESGPRLLAGTSETASGHAAATLRARGVRILLNDRLEGDELLSDGLLSDCAETSTAAGRPISYDLLLWCVGGRPNTGYMQRHFDDALDDAGRIKVTEDLLVTGRSALFAIGDINDMPENKMAVHIKGQIAIAEANIRLLASGGPREKLKAYKPQTGNPMMAVTLGREAGLIQLPKPLGLIRAGWFNRRVKARHMLVPRYRKKLDV